MLKGLYAPVHWLKLRTTYSSRSGRPTSPKRSSADAGFFNIVDPCSVENIGGNPNYAKNCAAAGLRSVSSPTQTPRSRAPRPAPAPRSGAFDQLHGRHRLSSRR